MSCSDSRNRLQCAPGGGLPSQANRLAIWRRGAAGAGITWPETWSDRWRGWGSGGPPRWPGGWAPTGVDTGLIPRGPPGRRGSGFPSFPPARVPRPSLDRGGKARMGPQEAEQRPRAESPHPGALATLPTATLLCPGGRPPGLSPAPQLPSQQAASLAAQLLLLFLVSPF